jgi:hypothetical protein
VLRVFVAGGKIEERPIHNRAEVRLIVPMLLQTRCFGLPNSFGLSCTARARVTKPTRRDARKHACRRLDTARRESGARSNDAGGVPPANLVC